MGRLSLFQNHSENIKMNSEDKKVDKIIKWIWRFTFIVIFFTILKLLIF